MTLSADIARCPDYAHCPGAGWDDCQDCQRRTAPGGEAQISPPAVVALYCENYIMPDGLAIQQLRELARQINEPTNTSQHDYHTTRLAGASDAHHPRV